MSNNVFSDQSNLVYRHFFVVVLWLLCIFFFFFYGMLNVGYYFCFLAYPHW